MKKVSIFTFIVLFVFVFLSCSKPVAQNWEIEEKTDEQNGVSYFQYEIVTAPEEYAEYIHSNVYYCADIQTDQTNLYFFCSKKESINNLLNTGRFDIRQFENGKIVFIDFPVNMKTKISKEQLEYMWQMFEEHYVGFSEMQQKGLTKKKFLKIKNYSGFQNFMEEYVEDCHMSIYLPGICFHKPTCHDEDCVRSIDPAETFFETETSNAYYVRFCNCTSQEYSSRFPRVSYNAIDKDFIILDARSNSGGSNSPQYGLQTNLSQLGFKGTVVVLQDNYSYSAGEAWVVFGQPGSPYKCVLVGTHSGGMQRFGNIMPYQNLESGILMTLCYTDFNSNLPDNYLGEGKGYEPDIWATTPEMKTVLEEMGIDTGDIVFQ